VRPWVGSWAGRHPLLRVFSSPPAVTAGRALPSPGGYPLTREGRVIGGVGVGGGTPAEDDTVALAAVRAVAD